MQYNINKFDDDSEHGPAHVGGKPTSDADIRIKVGEWIDITSPSANSTTPKSIGMGLMAQAPGVTLGIGTVAEAPVWVTNSVVTIQVIGLVASSALHRRRSKS